MSRSDASEICVRRYILSWRRIATSSIARATSGTVFELDHMVRRDLEQQRVDLRRDGRGAAAAGNEPHLAEELAGSQARGHARIVRVDMDVDRSVEHEPERVRVFVDA